MITIAIVIMIVHMIKEYEMEDKKYPKGERPELIILDDFGYIGGDVKEIEHNGEMHSEKIIGPVMFNLLRDPFYRPYCGNPDCEDVPKTIFKDKQFECPSCGWRSEFEEEFIKNLIKRMKEKGVRLAEKIDEEDYLNYWPMSYDRDN